MKKALKLEGQRFGRLIVMNRVEPNCYNQTMWRCMCDCGRETIVRGSRLRAGGVKSCGCLRSDLRREHAKIHMDRTTHGGSKGRLYRVWRCMKQRCCDPRRPDYPYYGGRGISVCDEWMHDYQAFHIWAMANGYNPTAPKGKCTIDRIDVNGNYCPENCRFVSMKIQNTNRRCSGQQSEGIKK